MTYDIRYSTDGVDVGGVFQSIDRTLGITVGSDARDPLDYDEFVIPRTTPMAPVRFTSVEVGANTHNHGVWMPVRRVLVTVIDDATTFTVVDANPFHTSDHIVSIDSAGPVTGGGIDLALITQINYTTNLITVTATAGLAVGDWVEVMENCSCALTAVVPSNWQDPQVLGMMLGPQDMRDTHSSTAGTPMQTTVVTHGAIQADDLNFPDAPIDDLIILAQAESWNVASGGIQIIPYEHGDEDVNIPDFYFPSSSSSSSSFSSSSSCFSSSSCSSSVSSSSSSVSSCSSSSISSSSESSCSSSSESSSSFSSSSSSISSSSSCSSS